MKETLLKKRFDNTMSSLATIMDQYGGENLSHAKHVAIIATALSEVVMPDKRDIVFYSSLLHDIGALVFGKHILNFPSKDKQKENVNILNHPVVSAEIISKICAIKDASDYVINHHECYDGSGYPKNLSGNNIPLGAQLIHIADLIDNYMYNEKNNLNNLHDQLSSWKGHEFKPDLLNAVLDLTNGKRQLLGKIYDKNNGNEIFSDVMKSVKPYWVDSKYFSQNFVKVISYLFGRITDTKCGQVTQNHTGYVSFLSEKIATNLELPDLEIEKIKSAAFLLNVWKIFMINDVLKKDYFTTSEKHILSPSLSLAREFLNNIEIFNGIANIGISFFERYDGNGYPFGLSGEDIPIGSRILSVADIMVSMLSGLQYQGPSCKENIIIQLERCTGTQFDPKVVVAAMAILDNKEIIDEITGKKASNDFKIILDGLCKSHKEEAKNSVSLELANLNVFQKSRPKLGRILVELGMITEEQLITVLAENEKENIGQSLLKLNFISTRDIAIALSIQSGIEMIELHNYSIDHDVLELIPEAIARKYKMLAVSYRNGRLQVALANPYDVVAIDEVGEITRMETIDVLIASEEEIVKTLDKIYGKDAKIEVQGIEPSPGETDHEGKETSSIIEAKVNDITSTVELVNHVILQGIKNEATDIHIEPEETCIRIRYRIDGILHENPSSLRKNLQSAVITRIKIMSGLDISENRIPQDGRAEFNEENRKIDIRVSTLPGIFGENIVMRILDNKKTMVGLGKLGFSPQMLGLYEQALAKQNGIILVTGPTGSGKTTTLYSSITYLNSKEENIITLEDPVEYLLPSIRQIQINPKSGLTFATGLRSILRQDPDVIFVGEIRDVETMGLAVQSALTGHLVLSTLHTNDAPSAITRLIDMGTENFLLSSTMLAVLSQRLVRIICTNCKVTYTPDAKFLDDVAWKGKKTTFYKGRGCKKCNKTGYKGRIGIFELLMVSPKVKQLIMQSADSGTIKDLARKEGMETMLENGLKKVEQGITTIEEIMRVIS